MSDAIDGLPQQSEWAGLPAVGRVESTRRVGDKATTDSRYALCSFPDLARLAGGVRGHWRLENGQHPMLAVQFRQDANRARQDASAENLAWVRRMTLNGIRHHGPSKDSVRRRQLRASLNDDYRAQLIFGPQLT